MRKALKTILLFIAPYLWILNKYEFLQNLFIDEMNIILCHYKFDSDMNFN